MTETCTILDFDEEPPETIGPLHVWGSDGHGGMIDTTGDGVLVIPSPAAGPPMLSCQRCQGPIRAHDTVYAIEGEVICGSCAHD